jgi:hypothetical protein
MTIITVIIITVIVMLIAVTTAIIMPTRRTIMATRRTTATVPMAATMVTVDIPIGMGMGTVSRF